MGILRKISAALVAATALTLGSTAAQAEEYGDSINAAPSAEAMAMDLIVIRPLGVVATVLGVGLFVAELPIALITWNLHDPAQRLVVEPARFTFSRQLGDMN